MDEDSNPYAAPDSPINGILCSEPVPTGGFASSLSVWHLYLRVLATLFPVLLAIATFRDIHDEQEEGSLYYVVRAAMFLGLAWATYLKLAWTKFVIGPIGVVIVFLFLGNVVLNRPLVEQNLIVYSFNFLLGIVFSLILLCPRRSFRNARRTTENRAA
ncbi:hypothetical protein AB1L88_26735 [Tautonia sp. JC769]|uniref:hypothetical protein n=1 Tax=Tautonia sp. JC769 TaxID=3232135 RepID=UPI003458127C